MRKAVGQNRDRDPGRIVVSIRYPIRLSRPGGEHLTGFLAKVLHYFDRAAAKWKGKLLMEGDVVETSSGGVFAGGRVIDSLQPCPVDRRKTHRARFATAVNLAARQ